MREVTDALPSAQEIPEGAMTDEQRDEPVDVRTERLDALDVLNRHEWWATADDRHDAWKAPQKAAKS